MADVYLTQKDIDYISRVVATEVPASLAQSDPAEYSRMVGAVVDTITNRVASGEYPSTVTGVVNQRNQFSAINGPIAGAYGSVQNTPKASPELQSLVASHVADISQGVEESEIGGSMNYANPNFSSAKNLRDWVNPMIEAGAVKLGLGDAVHYHGIIPGDQAVGPYSLSAEGIPTTQNVAVPVDNPMKGLLAVVDPYDPNTNLRTGSLMAPAPMDWGTMAQANIEENQKPSLIGPNVDILSASTQPIGQPVDVAATNNSGWGLNRDVAPSLIPTLNSWAPVAAAGPISAPIDSVTASGLLAGVPAMDAQTTARPTIDFATNTQSFMDQPSVVPAPANLGSFPDAYAAQRQPSTGLLSADFQSLVGNTERQIQDPSSLAPMVQQQTAMMNIPAAGLLAGNAPLSAQAVANVPAQTVQAPAVDNTVTGSITPGLLSPTSIASANAPLSFTPSAGILPGQPVQQNAFVDSFPSAVANNQIEPATVNDVVAAPTLDSIQVSEQPTVASQTATVEGPATTPALEQQKQAAVTPTDTVPSTVSKTTPAATVQNKVLLSGLLSKETALGGILGGLALGPAGGVVGALAGQQIARNGGLGGLFSPNSFSPPTSQIAGGVNNIGGIYGGAYSPGTFAVANNGTTITAQPGGWTTTTNRFGVTETVGPDGKISSYFGGGATPDDPETSTSSGGFFGGLFG